MSRKPRAATAPATASTQAAVAPMAAPPPVSFPASSRGTVLQDVAIGARGVTLSLSRGQVLEGIDASLRRALNAGGAEIHWEDGDA